MYQWQNRQWQYLMHDSSNLPHALLLRGRAGTGKHTFAINLAQALLCQQKNKTYQACGECPSCLWFAEGAHPDFRLIEPEDVDSSDEAPKNKSRKKSQISVAQIRQLVDYLSLSNHQEYGWRIVLISPAEALNIAAANALLKMLEEPPANTLFILVTNQPQRLLPTILSRCQMVDMPLPDRSYALTWLASKGVKDADNILDYAGGAPLLALQADEEVEMRSSLIKILSLGAKLDPFTSTPLLLGMGMVNAIDTLQKWIFDLTTYKLAQVSHYHSQHAGALQALSKSVNLQALLSFQTKLLDAKKLANHPLNNELQLENILLQYTQLFMVVNLKKRAGN